MAARQDGLIRRGLIRRDLEPALIRAAAGSPSVTLTGPRQSGKTTLCQSLFAHLPYSNLEFPDVRSFALEDPRAFLAQFPDGAVIDEVQRVPDLLSYLQGLIDNDPRPGRWIVSGSHNPAFPESVSQSLAGRTSVMHLLPLTHGEVTRFDRHPVQLEETLLAGGYPRIFDRRLDPSDWYRSYVATYLERDVRLMRNVGNLTTFQRFVQLCAGRSSQLLNYQSIANGCGVSQPTVKAWISLLEATFVAFRLPSYSGNVRKRLVKAPKLFLYDSGLMCWLLGIRDPGQLRTHPLRGAVFETWVVAEIVKHRANRMMAGELSFYRDRHGAEADLVIEDLAGLTVVEAKSAATASTALLSGSRRVRRSLKRTGRPCDVTVVYGGDQFQKRTQGWLVPWRMLEGALFPS